MLIGMLNLLCKATLETAYMTLVSGFLAGLFGIPLGILLFITQTQGIRANPWCNRILAIVVNAVRSIPFIILMVAIIPLTRLLVGTSIGTTAAIVPLTLAAIPFMARLTESALLKVNPGLIEAGFAMGADPKQIIRYILLPEARSHLIHAITITFITLVGYSAMAGAVGGGGLGDVAITYGYQRFNPLVMLITVVILIAMVQVIQVAGDVLAKWATH